MWNSAHIHIYISWFTRYLLFGGSLFKSSVDFRLIMCRISLVVKGNERRLLSAVRYIIIMNSEWVHMRAIKVSAMVSINRIVANKRTTKQQPNCLCYFRIILSRSNKIYKKFINTSNLYFVVLFGSIRFYYIFHFFRFSIPVATLPFDENNNKMLQNYMSFFRGIRRAHTHILEFRVLS